MRARSVEKKEKGVGWFAVIANSSPQPFQKERAFGRGRLALTTDKVFGALKEHQLGVLRVKAW